MANHQAIALLHACASGDEPSVAALLSDGVNPNIQDEMGWNPLMRAANSGYDRIVEFLVNAKVPASVRVANKHGKTALHYACMQGSLRAVQMLIVKGADPSKTDKGGRTPVDEAQDSERSEIVNLITTLRPEVVIPPRAVAPDATVTSESSLMLVWPATVSSELAAVRYGAGHAKLIGYRVQYARFRDGVPGKWTVYTTQPREPRIELLGLQPGVTYVARVAAVNGFGRGPYSSISLPVTTRRLESPASRTSSPSPVPGAETSTSGGDSVAWRSGPPSPSHGHGYAPGSPQPSSFFSATSPAAPFLSPLASATLRGSSRQSNPPLAANRRTTSNRNMTSPHVLPAADPTSALNTPGGMYWGSAPREDRLLAAIAANLEYKPSVTIPPPAGLGMDDESNGLSRTLPRVASTPLISASPARVRASPGGRTARLHVHNEDGDADRRNTGLRALSDLSDSLDDGDSGLDPVSAFVAELKPVRRRSTGKFASDNELARYKGDPETLKVMSAEELTILEETLERSLKRVREVKAKRLQEALGEQKDRQQCIVCQDAPKCVLLLPCRHLCMCKECHGRMKASSNVLCPVCRGPVVDSLDVYS